MRIMYFDSISKWLSSFHVRLYGVKVIGIDLNEAATNWARKHSLGIFYNTNGGNLSWIPDQTFNHFFSFGAVCYIKPVDVCKFGKEVVRILKPKGTALFGWLNSKYGQPYGYQPKTVWDCIKNMSGVETTIHDDHDLWKSPGNLISNTGSYSVILKVL